MAVVVIIVISMVVIAMRRQSDSAFCTTHHAANHATHYCTDRTGVTVTYRCPCWLPSMMPCAFAAGEIARTDATARMPVAMVIRVFIKKSSVSPKF